MMVKETQLESENKSEKSDNNSKQVKYSLTKIEQQCNLCHCTVEAVQRLSLGYSFPIHYELVVLPHGPCTSPGIYIPLDQKSQKSTQKRTKKSNRAQKSTQKSNEAQKSTQKSKFTQKRTQKSNGLKKELKKVKLNGHFTQKSTKTISQKSTQKSKFTQKSSKKAINSEKNSKKVKLNGHFSQKRTKIFLQLTVESQDFKVKSPADNQPLTINSQHYSVYCIVFIVVESV